MELKGSTRGRGSNPHTGKSSTLPSNLILNFPSNEASQTLSYPLLLEHYYPYFGLLMSKLYVGSLDNYLSSYYPLKSKRMSLL
jgi:hypothetical protein